MKPNEIIEKALREDRLKLLEHEAFMIAEYYDIPTPKAVLVKSPDEAYDLADKIGYPIAMKIVSPDITHKSDVGGVRLDIMNREDARIAVKEIFNNVTRNAPDAKIEGVLMYKMAPHGLEVIIGGIRDGVFGPTIMFGLGGIFVEVLKDVSFRIAPITYEEAVEMINEIKSARILDGFRGRPPVDKKAIADIIIKLGKLMDENPRIESVDLNPVIVYQQGAIAVDVRIILSKVY